MVNYCMNVGMGTLSKNSITPLTIKEEGRDDSLSDKFVRLFYVRFFVMSVSYPLFSLPLKSSGYYNEKDGAL
jgi:hypothetical protein